MSYRDSKGGKTEHALLKVANDLLTAMDTGKVSVLTLLDLSAAFDTTGHDILLHHLEHTFSFQGTALAWFRSYLPDRTQTVSIDLSQVLVYIIVQYYFHVTVSLFGSIVTIIYISLINTYYVLCMCCHYLLLSNFKYM